MNKIPLHLSIHFSHRGNHRSQFGAIGILIMLGITVTVAAASPPELLPVATEIVVPVADNSAMQRLTTSSIAPTAINNALNYPVSAARFRAIKNRARTTPLAQKADQIPRPRGPRLMSSDITRSFRGLDRPSAADQGSVFFPPNTTVAQSNTRMLEATNSAVRLFTNTGGVLATKAITPFFGANSANGPLFAPKIYWDRNGNYRRFYVVALQRNAATRVSKIWLAISRSSDPGNLESTSWCRYEIDGRRDAGTSNDSYADQPGLGAGASALLITTNQFKFATGNGFTYAIIRALNKIAVANNASACPIISPLYTFRPSGVLNNATVYALQPVQHYTSPSSFGGTSYPAYLINTYWGNNNRYRVWRVRNINVPGVVPTLQGPTDVIGTFTYGIPPDAPQPGTNVLLDTGDNRVTQVAGQGNALWAVHGTICKLGGIDTNGSCVRVMRILVGQSSVGALTATISQQRTFGYPYEYYFWPGVAVNALEQTIVPFQFVSDYYTDGRLSTGWTVKELDVPNFAMFAPITTGNCSQTLSKQTGNYVGAQTAPDNRTFTLAGASATTIANACQWQTQVISVDPGFELINE